MSPAALLPLIEVLVADDDRIGRSFCVSLLQAAGTRVVTADDGATAIRQALARAPAVILMDLRLPDMSGFSAAAQIFAAWPQPRPACRMIAMTADAGDAARARLERRVDGQPLFVQALLKPFGAEQLRAALDDARSASPPGSPGPDRPEPFTHPAGPASAADLRALREAFRHRLGGDLLALDDTLAQLDWPGADELLHRLRGASSMIGFPRLAQLCQRLQRQLPPAGSVPALADAYHALRLEAAMTEELDDAC